MALAGFSGVVVGVRRAGQGKVQTQDKFGLLLILTTSGLAMLFSLLPSAMQLAGVSQGDSQTISNFILGLFTFIASIGLGIASRRTRPRYLASFWILVFIGTVLGLALLLTTIGVLTYSGDFSGLLLLWLLLVGFTQFFTFLVLTWSQGS